MFIKEAVQLQTSINILMFCDAISLQHMSGQVLLCILNHWKELAISGSLIAVLTLYTVHYLLTGFTEYYINKFS